MESDCDWCFIWRGYSKLWGQRRGKPVNQLSCLIVLSWSYINSADGLIRSRKSLNVDFSADNCVPLLIQQNVDGSNFFNRSWAEFKVGFNDTSGNYWFGNDLLSQLTMNGRYKLRFDLQGRGRGWYYAEYTTFRVMSELNNYKLQVASDGWLESN